MFIGFLVMVAYVPGVTGAALPTGWMAMWLVMPFLLLFHEIPRLTVVHWLGLTTLAYAVLSLLWFPNGLWGLMKLAAMASVFVYASSLNDIRPVLRGLALGLGVSAVVAVFQSLGISVVYSADIKPAGLFINSNALAEASALLALLLVSARMWVWLPVTAPGLICSSRAVMLGLIVAVLAWVWDRSRKAAVALATISAVALGIIIAYFPFGNQNSVNQRLDLWRDTIDGLTWRGWGIGSFDFLYPMFASHVNTMVGRPQFAHNDSLQLLFELGIGALPLLIMVLVLLGVKDDNRPAYACFLVISLFGFPTYLPVTGFLAALMAGRLSRAGSFIWNGGLDGRSAIRRRLAAL